MGTRSTTRFIENGQVVLVLYKQYDGYPDDWGKKIKQFIKGGKFVSGFKHGSKLNEIFNGFGDMIAQFVNKFKDCVGDLYVTTGNDKQEYNYTIEWNSEYNEKTHKSKVELVITCEEEPKFTERIKMVL